MLPLKLLSRTGDNQWVVCGTHSFRWSAVRGALLRASTTPTPRIALPVRPSQALAATSPASQTLYSNHQPTRVWMGCRAQNFLAHPLSCSWSPYKGRGRFPITSLTPSQILTPIPMWFFPYHQATNSILTLSTQRQHQAPQAQGSVL